MESSEICCPKFDPVPWEAKEFEWRGRKFIKAKVFTLFYMPLNFGSVMRKLNDAAQKSGAEVLDGMWLSDHTSKWNMDLYVAVDKEVADTENVVMEGKFISKVYEGDFKDTGSWAMDFENYVKSKGMSAIRSFMWYTTCPKCAKKYGKNYTVMLAKV